MVLETSATDEASLEIAAGLLALVKGREVAKQGQQEDLKQVSWAWGLEHLFQTGSCWQHTVV